MMNRLNRMVLPIQVLCLLFLFVSVVARATPSDLPPLRTENGGLLTPDGTPVALYGVNLFQSHMFWGRRQKLEEAFPQLEHIAALGFNAVRMPLNMAWFEPAEGVFPDSPRYAEIMRKHRLPTGAMTFYDALIHKSGALGMYVIPEFHELPVDPYRYFVGGHEQDRKTGKPGTAIAWLAVRDPKTGKYSTDWTTVRRELPRVLGWLAGHWQGVTNIAGIEVPWNEPRGPLTEPAAYFDLVQACADAVKSADPNRLAFMDCVDWGAMVNRMPDESLWRIPTSVDGLMPHFYPGMHSGNSGAGGTWSTSMANWVSWFGGSGKVVLVGEYGVVEMKRARYWRDGVTDADRAHTYAACGAQGYAMGIPGLFGWAWQGGIGRDPKTGALAHGAEELQKWAAPFRASPYVLGRARIAVVCARKRRARYGGKKDLWRITDALLDAGLTPFTAVFPSQVREQPEVLKRFDAVVVYEPDLPAGIAAVLDAAPNIVGRLDQTLRELDRVIAATARRVPPRPDPPGLIVGQAPGRIVVFNRKPVPHNGSLRVRLQDGPEARRIVVQGAAATWRGTVGDLAKRGLSLSLAPWECRELRWSPAAP